ncbi:MAG TPA: class I SAM-dependent methyltransferase [Flavobacteriales bacterium]|nr:class I SAM-dependent methyltransferase [Flavobacteriales bacterium]
MKAEYYKEYYKLEREHWWFKGRNKIILSLLKKQVSQRPLKILNVGVATGHTSELLSSLGDVVSVEPDEECCNFLTSELKLEVVNASGTDLPFENNQFDLVCAFDVIEHIDDDTSAVKELKRVCKSEGLVFVTVPAFMFLWSIHDEVNQHFRRYNLKELTALFINEGNIIFRSYFNFIFFIPITLVRTLGKLFSFHRYRSGSGSDFSLFKASQLNNLFFKLFSVESLILKSKIKFPFGVSLLLCWKKNK